MAEPSTPNPTAPNWVHDVGYANEKLHAGFLSRLILRSTGEPQRALLDALWQQATGKALPAGPLDQVEALREAPLDGQRLRLDLLVSFRLNKVWYRLGFELKVDNPPDDKQLRQEVAGLARKYSKDERALVLLCLGMGQVAASAAIAGVQRWSPETLIRLEPHVTARPM